MNIEYEPTKLTEQARKDKVLRERLLATKNSEDSLKSFCEICNEIGFANITIYEMSTLGEQFCAAMLRSVNGGGVEAPDAWDNCYELLMSELEQMK